MERCLALAKPGLGSVSPNPMVGAVLVHDDLIIGEGWHKIYGGPHAEVNCLSSVLPEYQHLIPDATMYVSLEPCNHYGKTPPCSLLIEQADIKKLVVGCRDPFHRVNGKGIEHLRSVGVDVLENVLENECKSLNKRFFTFHQKNRPYIILKWAETADGFTGTKDRRVKITGAATDILVHKWRTEEDAIMIGKGTALADDPQLNARHWPGRSPVRLVLDSLLEIPSTSNLYKGGQRTIIINELRESIVNDIELVKIPGFNKAIELVIPVLIEKNIQSVIVEGGTTLLQSFIEAGLWDEAICITNTRQNLGQGIPAPKLKNQQLLCTNSIEPDEIKHFINTSTT